VNNVRARWTNQPGIKGHLGLKPWEANVPNAEYSGASSLLGEGMTGYKAILGMPRPGKLAIGKHFTTEVISSSLGARNLSALNYRPLGYLKAPIRPGRYPTYSTARQLGQTGGALEYFASEPFGPATYHVYPDLQVLFAGSVVGAETVAGNLNKDVFGEEGK